MQINPWRCGMVLAGDAHLSSLICLIWHSSLNSLRIYPLNIHLTSLRLVRSQLHNISHLLSGWERAPGLGRPIYSSCSLLCWLWLWLSRHECQPQTLTVRIWLLCRAATVGKPGGPYGHSTVPKQHDTVRHTDISLLDKQNEHIPNV